MTWLLALLFILLKGDMLRWKAVEFFDLDLVIILLAFLITFCGLHAAGIFALSLGVLTDLFSVGPLGLLTLLYIIGFLLVYIGSYLLDCRAYSGISILVAAVVLLKSVLLMFLWFSFGLGRTISFSTILAFMTSAVFSGLIAPFIFYGLKKGMRLVMQEVE